MSLPAQPSAAGRLAVLGLLSLSIGVPSAAVRAQVRVGARGGVLVSSNLVRDSIGVEPITVRANTAPFLGVTLETHVNPDTWLGASVQVGRSDLVSKTPSDETSVATLTVWTPAATLSRRLTPWFAVTVRAGAVIYRPSNRLGTIFQDGTPVEPVLGASVSAYRPLGSRFTAAVEIGYDAHRFTTARLEREGFTGSTTVHRLTVGISIRAGNGAQGE